MAANEDVRKELVEFCKDIGNVLDTLAAPAKFAWGTVQRMERFGQIVGLLVCSILIGRVVKKVHPNWRKRWAEKKSHKKFVGKHFVMSQFEINPILPAIKLSMFHYTYAVEKIVGSAKDDWEKLESRFEDILLGDPRFRDIIEEDEGLTLPKLIEIVKATEAVLEEWIKKITELPGLHQKFMETAERLKNVGPADLPNFDDLREGNGNWVREVFLFVALTHLHGALRFIGEALAGMLEPVNPKDQKKVSVALVLKTLGFDIKESDAYEALDRDFDEVFKESSAPA